jgi:MOSC domain-containing protein YiiM
MESLSVPTVIEIRVGRLQSPEIYKEKLPIWPTDIDSAYWKLPVNEVEATFDGLSGNAIGHPSHSEEGDYRAVMVYNELNNAFFHQHYPDHVLKRGDFGENFVVNHPSLLATEVCIGDEYQVGTAKFQVTGPRKPCPKVDAAQQLKGIQQLGLENGWTGFFFRVLQPGTCRQGDEIILLSRPNPGYTIYRVASGVWGPPEKVDNSKEFLNALINMEALIPRGYRDTAKTRLARLENN